jgi:photosystem II stability/assembly factor-like uncharacterized protein
MTILFTCFLLSCLAQADPVWHNLGPGGGGWIQSIRASSHDPDELFVGCDVGGFYRSTDGGASYKIHNTGLQDYWVECIVPHPNDPDTIYLGCESGVYKSTDRGQTWQWLREGFPPKQRHSWSAPIGALAIDQNAPNTLYAGIGRPRRYEHGKGAVYKTTDGGSHWSRINSQGSLPDDALVSDLLIDPDDSNHLYLACQYGVYQSHDSGVNWELTIDGLPHPHVRRLALCRGHPDVIYLTLRSSPGKEPWQGGVCKSTDGGKSWKPCIEGLKQYVGKPGQPGPMTTNYDRLVVHPENPHIAYVGGDAWVTATIYKTTDGGRTWTEVVRRGEDSNIEMGWINMWGPSVKCLTMSPLDPDLLYFGTSGHVFKTTDGGQHWRQVYTEVFPDGRFRGTGLEVTCVHNIIIHPKDAERLYFGYFDIGLLISDDRGKTFRRCVKGVEPRDMQNSCFDVAFDPDDPSHCWGSFGTWGQNIGVIAESSDGGMTWRIVGSSETGLPDARHRVLTVDPASPPDARHLLTTADGKGIYLSEDNGHTWQERNNGLPYGDVRDLASHPTQPGVYWCALGTGAVYYTDDRGATWRQVSQNLEATDVKRLVVAPGDPRRLYLAARDHWNGSRTLPGGVYRSDDSGKTWKRVLEDDFVQGLAVDTRNADVVYAGLTDHPYHDESTGDGVMMSRDGGNTWKSINGTGLSCKQVNLIVIDPHNPDRLYLGTGGNSVFVGDVSLRNDL